MVEIVIILIGLFINGLLACFEMAFVSVSKPHLKKLASQGSRAAATILNLRANPERTLSVIQVGITMVGMISAAAEALAPKNSLHPLSKETLSFQKMWLKL